MADKVKIQTRINSFDEVQKSLQTIEQKLNELSGAVNLDTKGQVTDKEGKPGDIRVTKNPDKSHKLEVKTEEGWKYGSLGEKPVKYIDKPAEFSKPTAIESGNLPLPDYDTGFFQATKHQIWTTGFTDGEFPNDLTDKLKFNNGIFEWYYHDANKDLVKGLPALGFKMQDSPTLIQSIIAPPGCSTWQDCLSTGQVIVHNGQGFHYVHNYEKAGMQFLVMGEDYFSVRMPDWGWIVAPGITGISDFNSSHSSWYTAFDAGESSDNATVRIKVWK